MFYLWSSPDRYLNKHTADYRVIYDLEKPGNTPVNGLIRIQINELKSQPYAIMVYHDENRTYNFERNFIGLPMEGFAFGNKISVKIYASNHLEADKILNTKPFLVHFIRDKIVIITKAKSKKEILLKISSKKSIFN